MTAAAELAREGAPHGTAVVADEQTAGIGRHGHSWHSQPGGLYVSIILRLPNATPIVMLALGLAARDAIASVPLPYGRGSVSAAFLNRDREGVAVDLRWPNDVLLNGRKCAGVIAQREGGAVIAGIGINVNQTAFPEGIDATSLLLAGATTSSEAVLEALLNTVDRYCAEEPAEVRRMFEASSSYARNRRVRVEQDDIEGITQGLDANGFLLVRQDNGQMTTILAGGVRPCS